MTDAKDTATIDLPPAGAGPQMRMVAVASIVASTTNPRKTFNQDKLQELANSIRESGVHQPILLRPLPASRVEETTRAAKFEVSPQAAWPFPPKGAGKRSAPIEYELVAGERRWRACQLAAVVEVPAMIRHLTDAQVLEIQIIENLQREDVTELEEAEGYGYLMEANKLNADQVAEKIGKSRSYVYARLKLLDLCQEAREALRAGDLDASRGLLLARIPDGALQLKALKEATRKDGQGEQPSYRTLQTWLRQNVMLALERAVFAIADANLVKAAGSCKECPKRTGANPDLFAEIPKGSATDLCTDPACYHGKEDAHRTQLRKKAEAKGMAIIEGKEAGEITSPYGTYLKGYSRLDGHRHDTADGEAKPLRALLGKGAPQAVLIENPHTKELIEAVPTAEAEAWLVTQGVLKEARHVVNAEADIERLQKDLPDRLRTVGDKAVRSAVDERLITFDGAQQLLMNPDFLRAWLLAEHDGGGEPIGPCLSIPEQGDDEAHEAWEERVRLHLQRLDGPDLFRTVVRRMFETPCWLNDAALHLAAARGMGLDTVPAEREAQEAERKAVNAKIKDLKAKIKATEKPVASEKPAKKLQKAATATKLAAPAGEGAGGEAEAQADMATPSLKPAARAGGKGKKGTTAEAPKTSKEHASQEIAAGLQALEQESAPGGAAAPQGDEAPALAGAADAGEHAPAEAHAQAPAAQGVDRRPGAPAQAAEAVGDSSAAASQAGGVLAIGVTVKVNATARGPKQAPHVGKTGTIQRKMGATAWDVAIPRAKRGVPQFVSFDSTELDVVEA
ncbi:ParB-like partition protein [Acidovorax sp. CF316]|uniref:ParB/RepB/Spo0J family partition protein n=1 Tax=Acidovorax sp. CF316 TaxID=1144317 RepID=UPI00026BC805|nr:ParB/RepB/Spo0J family partition protein [Acidovorax sp. CF316]EJE49602.1 ParB-like partition protein [Acidovorax sp. CF316]